MRQSGITVAKRIVLSYALFFSVWALHSLITSAFFHIALFWWIVIFCLFTYIVFVTSLVSFFSAKQQHRPSVSLTKRIVLSYASLFSVWALHSLITSSVFHKESAAPWTGMVCLFTYMLFVVPIVTLSSAECQLRRWYVLLTGSVLWAIGWVALVFHSVLLEDLQQPFPGNMLIRWPLEFAIVSSMSYLVLLRRALQRAAVPPR